MTRDKKESALIPNPELRHKPKQWEERGTGCNWCSVRTGDGIGPGCVAYTTGLQGNYREKTLR